MTRYRMKRFHPELEYELNASSNKGYTCDSCDTLRLLALNSSATDLVEDHDPMASTHRGGCRRVRSNLMRVTEES
jgi:hypothetical protein